MWGEEIIELNPSNNEIIWKWNSFDHSTTTLESSSNLGGNYESGGNILYRWGNPQMYNMSDNSDQKLFFSHDAHWIDKTTGLIRYFNNGGNFRNYSTVETIQTPLNEFGNYSIDTLGVFYPLQSIIDFIGNPEESFYSPRISGSQQLENGNILICEGAKGKIFEVDNNNNIVWQYANPVDNSEILYEDELPSRNQLFQVRKYSDDYDILKKKELTPYDPIEKSNLLSL